MTTIAGCGPGADLVDAAKWCWPATGANGTVQSGKSLLDMPIVTSSGFTVTGCTFLCPADHTVMRNGEDGDYSVGSSLYDRWQELRELAKAQSLEYCNAYVDFIEEGVDPGPGDDSIVHFDGLGDVTCEEAIDAEEPFRAASPGGGSIWSQVSPDDVECGVGGGAGTAGSGSGPDDRLSTGSSSTASLDDSTGAPLLGPALYGLISFDDVMSCHRAGTMISCSVDRDFYTNVIGNEPELLYIEDGAVVGYARVGGIAGVEFTILPNHSLFHALGFRERDHVRTIDGLPSESLAAAALLLAAAQDRGSVVVKFRRNAGTYTMNLQLVDLHTHHP